MNQNQIQKKIKINSTSLVPIGKFGKTHGLKGEIRLISFCHPAENIQSFKNFFIDGEKVEISFSTQSSNHILVKINNITSIDEIKKYVNKEVSTPREDFPETDDGSIYWNDLIGSEVKNTDEKILGTVTKIENHGASDLLFIQGSDEEIIIPIEENFFKKFDNEIKLIVVEWEQE
ncbi:MAG: 16S rRNA processing protein RimM [Gammaproteobacteria bacterium]|nr:16S rRNA processing protein RimM [Gammaproteobacteria bacterium]